MNRVQNEGRKLPCDGLEHSKQRNNRGMGLDIETLEHSRTSQEGKTAEVKLRRAGKVGCCGPQVLGMTLAGGAERQDLRRLSGSALAAVWRQGRMQEWKPESGLRLSAVTLVPGSMEVVTV